jgi:branched-chain amino acid transport system substrate-binding protein
VPIGFAYATGGEVQTGLEQSYLLQDCEIKVIFRDDQTNPEIGAEAARELIEVEGADIIVGSVGNDVTAALQEIASEADVILIAAPDASTDPSGRDFDPNTFRASRSNYQDRVAMCDHFVNGNGYESFVQIAPDHAIGYGGAQAYRDACEFYGGEFVAEDVFAPFDTADFELYLTPIAESEADAFLVTWPGGGFQPLLESALSLDVINSNTALGAPFIDNVVMPGFFANMVGSTSVISYHHTAPSNPINDYLIEQAAATFDAFPDLFDADGMNAAIMVVEALKATGGAADSASLRAVLEGLSFEGPKGLVEIRSEDHVAIQDIYVVKLLNVDDPEFRFYDNVATLRPEPPCLLEGEYVARCGSLPVGSLSG